MDEARAISLVVDWIRSHGLDYPTEGLEADRFDLGWSVYVPVEIDETDPMAFLDLPVGRSVFLIGDCGRIQEVSSSVPPQQAIDRFIADELALGCLGGGAGESGLLAEFERQFERIPSGVPRAVNELSAVHAPPDSAEVAAEASRLLDPIVEQLARLGPPGWERFSAEFAFTVSAEVSDVRFWVRGRSTPAPVPESIGELVRRQRRVAAQLPDGPWWRLLLAVTNRGEATVTYDYGDEPFPDGQLMLPEHYRNDLASYPRAHLPVWLAGYVAGPGAQGRDPHRAATAAAADAAAGRTAAATGDLPPLRDVWARWAVLSAIHAGAGAEPGPEPDPRVFPGYASYENGWRDGSVLFRLPGERAVLSGGSWNSELLEAAYNGAAQLPDLYTGAPAWVTDSVLNTRNRHGLLTFCFWWADGRWYRGATDTAEELDACLPRVWTPDETVRAMTELTGPHAARACRALLAAVTYRHATADQLAALFTGRPRADIDTAVNQLDLAGLLAR